VAGAASLQQATAQIFISPFDEMTTHVEKLCASFVLD
jgi:hypothetical protein